MIWREQIYAQLFNELQTQCASANPDVAAQIAAVGLTLLPKVPSPAFAFGSRRWVAPGRLELNQYPALMLVEKGETFERELTYGPAKVTLVAHVHVQTASQDPNTIPATQANNLADVVQGVIETGAGQYSPGASRLSVPGPSQDILGLANELVFVCRVTGREVIYLAEEAQVFSQQTFEVEIIQTH